MSIPKLYLLEVEITNYCNRNCTHCYLREKNSKNMSFEEIQKIFLEAKNLEVPIIIISGGEPLVHPEFKKLVSFIKEYKKENNTKFFLLTNGDLIEKYKEEIKVFDVIQIGFDPLNFVRKETKLKSLIKHLSGYNVIIFITIYKKLAEFILSNKDEFEEILRKLRKFFKISWNFYVGNDEKLKLEKSLHFKILRLMKEFAEKDLVFQPRDVFSWICRDDIRESAELFPRKISAGCIAGVYGAVIDVFGNLYPCPFLRVKVGNVFENSLENIWKKSQILKKLRERSWCKECLYRNVCGGCRARALINNDIYGKDPYCPLETKFDEIASIYDSYFSSDFILEKIIEKIKDLNVELKNVLFLGCGTGNDILYFKKKFPNAKIVGLDISRQMASIAKRKLKKFKDVKIVINDIRYFYMLQKFDLALAVYDVVNNISPLDMEFFFYNVRYHLKDGGLFIFDILNTNLDSKKEKLIERRVLGNKVIFSLKMKNKEITIEEFLYDLSELENYFKKYFKLIEKEKITKNRDLIILKTKNL